MSTQTLSGKILSRLYGKKRGWVFTQVHFRDLGNELGIRQALKTLCVPWIACLLLASVCHLPALAQESPTPQAKDEAPFGDRFFPGSDISLGIPAEVAPCAALSADGSTLALSNWIDRIRVWDTRTGKLLCEISLDPAFLLRPSLCLSGDGKRLVVTDTNGCDGARIYDTSTGTLVKHLKLKPIFYDEVTQKRLDFATVEEVHKHVAETGSDVRALSSNPFGLVFSPGFVVSPDGKTIWMADCGFCFDSKWMYLLRIDIDSAELKIITYQPPHLPEDSVETAGLAINRSGTRLLVKGRCAGFTVFDTTSNTPVRHSYDSIWVASHAAMALSSDGLSGAVVTGPHERTNENSLGTQLATLAIRQARKSAEAGTPDKSGITSLAYTPNDSHLFAGTTGGRVLSWRHPHFRLYEPSGEREVTATLVACSADSRSIIAAYLTKYNKRVVVKHWNIYGADRLRSRLEFSFEEEAGAEETVPGNR